jgi:hypothetical protein
MAITNKDIDKLKEVFATKDDLKDLKNDMLGGLDKVMGELEKAREDRIFAIGKDREQDQRIDHLEKRVERVELKVGS